MISKTTKGRIFRSNRKFLVLIGLGILVLVGIWFYNDFGKSRYASSQPLLNGKLFYVPMKVETFSFGHIPCLNVEIEQKKFLFELDLGFFGETSIFGEFLSEIQNKRFLKSSSSFGFRGKEYPKDVYAIPQMKMGDLTFSNLQIDEENVQLIEDSAINPPFNKTSQVAGRIGWKLFSQSILLLDLSHSTIGISDSIETFKKQGFSLNKFVKVPLLNDRNLIEFETMTSKGPLRCFLDSGCTFNLLHTHNRKEKPLGQMIKEKKNGRKINSFKIGEIEFGPLVFNRLPINLPIHIDAILGMEFLLKHIVLIDFVNREIYFSKI